MRRESLRAHFQAFGFDTKFLDLIESRAERCVRIEAIPTDERELLLGRSKIGGFPDLAVGTPWPLHGDRPLTFQAQIDLQDLNPYRFCKILPPEGLVSFFLDLHEQQEYDPADRGNWRVIFHTGPREELDRRARPEHGLPPVPHNPCRIVFHEAWSPGWHEIPREIGSLDDYEADEYDYLIDSLPDEKAHQLLGKPGRIESIEQPMQLECQFLSNGILLGEDGKPLDKSRATELSPGATDWKLLLQLDSDSGAGMDWGDSMVSFWIRDQDLQVCDFSKVWQVDEWF